MKKIIIPVSIAFALILIVISCKKNQSDSDSMKHQSNQINGASQNVEHRILSFKSNIESNLKSGSTYTIDSAVWYTESLINYNYGDVQNNLEGISLDSVFINVDLTNGLVTLAEVSAVYSEIIDSLTVQYENLPSQNLHLIFADVYSKDSTAGTVTFGIRSAFGYGSALSVDNFGEDDYWWYGGRENNNGGYCAGEYSGENKDEDAASKIRDQIRVGMGVYQERHYATDIVGVLITASSTIVFTDPFQPFSYSYLNQEDEVPGDNMYDYYILLKYANVEPYDACIIPNEMNFYTYGADHVFFDEIYTATEGALGDRVMLDLDMSSGSHIYALWHDVTSHYGVVHYNPLDPEIFE